MYADEVARIVRPPPAYRSGYSRHCAMCNKVTNGRAYCRECIEDVMTFEEMGRLTVLAALEQLALFWGYDSESDVADEIKKQYEDTRKKEIVWARAAAAVAMFALGYVERDIGLALGRDRSTVSHYLTHYTSPTNFLDHRVAGGKLLQMVPPPKFAADLLKDERITCA